MSNIEVFDQYVAEVLARLYEAFPVPISFSTYPSEVDDLRMVPDETSKTEAESRKGLAKRATIQCATASWLQETGYFASAKTVTRDRDISIHFELDGVYHLKGDRILFPSITYENARLTAKGLEALRALPQSLSGESNSRKSLGEQLAEHAKDVTAEAKKQTISKIIGEIIGYAVRAMASSS
jgi:hypothetical protein